MNHDVQTVQRVPYAQRGVMRHQRQQAHVVAEVVAREAVRLKEARPRGRRKQHALWTAAPPELGCVRLLHQQQRVQGTCESYAKHGRLELCACETFDVSPSSL